MYPAITPGTAMMKIATTFKRAAKTLRLVKTIQMPFAKIRGMVSGIVERGGDRGLLRIELPLVAGYRRMRIEPGQQSSPSRTAQRAVRDRSIIGDSLFGQSVQTRSRKIRIPPTPECLSTVLIAKNPNNIRAHKFNTSFLIEPDKGDC